MMMRFHFARIQVACFVFAMLVCAEPEAPTLEKPVLAEKKSPKKSVRYLETSGEQKRDLVYKKVGKRELQLDLYYPTAKRGDSSPVIIFTHGGGWAAGSRAKAASGMFSWVFTRLLSEGFCVASVSYRLYRKGGEVAMRDCVIDCKDAVRYLAKNAKGLGLDKDRFYVMGDSAGGQIAQMLLLSSPETLAGDADLADADYQMLGGVSWYGPCDFEDQNLFNHDDRADFRDRFGPRIVVSEVSPEEKLRLYREMSPINYLRKESPPLLMIQGDRDTTIPVKHAYSMKKKAVELEAPVEILIVKNAGHNWRKVGAQIEPSRKEILAETVRFFVDYEKSLTKD